MAERKTTRNIASVKRALVLKDRATDFSKTNYRRTTAFIKRRPMLSFLLMIAVLFAFLILGKIFDSAPAEKAEQKQTKTVDVYKIGHGPQATFQAKIEKSGVVKIVAQSPGIVSNIDVKEGDSVWKGQQLLSLSTNYQGGNASSVQRQIADAQYKNVLDTFGLQTDMINKQRAVATASAQQAQQTRDITRQSLNDTNSMIDINQSQLDQINQDLAALNPSDKTYIEKKTAASQLQASLAQLRAGQRTTEYAAANDKAPALLATLQEDITLKQLSMQEQGVTLNKEISGLQSNLAAIAEGLMYPASPLEGTVERITVRKGQLVNPGTPLATIVSPEGKTTAVLLVPLAIARTIYDQEKSTLLINGNTISVTPTHIATEATDGQLYAVTYEIPAEQAQYLTDGEYISVQVPIGQKPRIPDDPLIPIDAVYQNQDHAYVLVINNNKAETRTVTAAHVYGGYVEVLKGLTNGDQIILNRNVIAGDTVKIQ
jgi:RND family efflux transporter MFP subunit